jgi:uncharacterized protein YjeT (DUF2065 family)
MFPIWLILGTVMVLLGIFNKQILRLLGLKPMSEVLTVANLKHSSRAIEQIGRWLVITLGLSFIVQGLGATLPNEARKIIIFSLLGLAGSMLGLAGSMILVIIGITIANWKAK